MQDCQCYHCEICCIIVFISMFGFLDGTQELLNWMVTLNVGNAVNFLVNLILICYNLVDRLCGLVIRVSGYRSWGSGFDSRRYQIFWEVVGLERGPLSLVRTIEEILEWKSSGSGLENRINDRRDPLRWPRDTLYPLKLALTWLKCGGCLVGIVRLRTKGHGVFFFSVCILSCTMMFCDSFPRLFL
jgi:hypothetical protein